MTGRSRFSQTNLVGQTIGHYAIMERLGEGGMGVVYRALKLDDSSLSIPIPVALKYPTTELDDAALARFLREMETLSLLSSPHIVGMKGLGVHEIDGEQRPYYAMEFLDCITLQKLLRDMHAQEKPLAIDTTLYIFHSILVALEYLHHCAMAHDMPIEVIHRDISPDNILIQRPQAPILLTDFGVSSAVQDRTLNTTIVGKPRYMPPEALDPDQECTTKMDIWSTAAVVWEMLHSDRFLGHLEHDVQVYGAILDHRLPSFDPSIPEPLVDLLERMLDEDPAERTSAPEAQAEILAIATTLGVHLEQGRRKLDEAMRGLYGHRTTSGKSEAFIPIINTPQRPPLLYSPSTPVLAKNPFDEDAPTIAISTEKKPSVTRVVSAPSPPQAPPPPASSTPPFSEDAKTEEKLPPGIDRIPKSLREINGIEFGVQGEHGWFVRLPHLEPKHPREHPIVDKTVLIQSPPQPKQPDALAATSHPDTTPSPSDRSQTLPPVAPESLHDERDIMSVLPWLTAVLALATIVFATLFFLS